MRLQREKAGVVCEPTPLSEMKVVSVPLFRSRGSGRGPRARAGTRGRTGLPAFRGRVHEVRLLLFIVLLILFLIVIFLLIFLFFGDLAQSNHHGALATCHRPCPTPSSATRNEVRLACVIGYEMLRFPVFFENLELPVSTQVLSSNELRRSVPGHALPAGWTQPIEAKRVLSFRSR